MKIARLINVNGCYKDQSLKDHLSNVAELCKTYMTKIGCPVLGYIAGLLHDAGKAGKLYQNYLERIRMDEPYRRGEVNHSSAGGILLANMFQQEKDVYVQLTLQLVVEAILCHHSSLLDNVTSDGQDGYNKRLHIDTDIDLDEVRSYIFSEIISQQDLKEKMYIAVNEIKSLFNNIHNMGNKLGNRIPSLTKTINVQYSFGLLLKYLESCLVDADWQDSFAVEIENRGYHIDHVLEENKREESRNNLWEKLLLNLESKFSMNMKTDKNNLNYWRTWISDQCKVASQKETGIYTLNCPTGAGKTFTSLRYALSHAISTKKTKIFYVVPYISILEQNAKSVREVLDIEKTFKEDMLTIIQEIHSGHVTEEEEVPEENRIKEAGEEYKDFMTERMISPIIFTTMVRFLNTFFLGGTRNIRPAHQFHDAVLIFDEIQSLPIRVVAMFNGLINFLSNVCNCTCILCSATQPLLHETDRLENMENSIFPLLVHQPMSLMEVPEEAYHIFKRVCIIPLLKENGGMGYSVEDLADLVVNKSREAGDVLVIMNTKNSALKLYKEVKNKSEENYKVIYISTLLYPTHRREVIENIKELLKQRKRMIVISTQLVEAGVDFSFSCVIRSLAGMDSIIQAAGRCNREGKDTIKNVYIVNPNEDFERLSRLTDIKEGADCTRRLLQEFLDNPDYYENDLLSEKAMRRYFEFYFYRRHSEMRYPISKSGESTLYELLASNTKRVKSAQMHYGYQKKALNQSFKEAGEKFRAIESIGQAVFVPRGKGKEILKKIERGVEFEAYKDLLRNAQQYVVNLSKYEIEHLAKCRGVLTYHEHLNMFVVNDMYYDDVTGLTGEVAEEIQLYQF